MNQDEIGKIYQEVSAAEITDGRTALRYLPLYAEYETKYGTKQCYEDIFRKMKGIPEKGRDGYYLFALMEIKERMIETMFEYQDGIRTMFKTEFPLISSRYDSMMPEEKAMYLAAGYLACWNKTLLSYRYLPALEEKYQRLFPVIDENCSEWMILKGIKQCYGEGEEL